jgi:anti-sigma factor RsiW
MNCEECQDFIDAYGDNELDAAATLGVKRHLKGCPECLQQLEAGSRSPIRFAPRFCPRFQPPRRP